MAIYNINGILIPTGGSVVSSVKDYGAKGDGTTNDAESIQNLLNELSETGGVIYFPVGVYRINQSLLFYSKQILYFAPGATLLQGASINSMLRTYCESDWTGYNGVHDCVIYGATFDGGSYTVNNTLVATVHAKNIVFDHCTFKNAYGNWHDLEISSSYNVKVVNCDFEGSRKTGENGEMLQIDSASSKSVYPWSGVNFDGTVSKYIDIDGCIFHDGAVAPAIGNHTNNAHRFIRVHDCIFDGISNTRGTIHFVSNMTDIDIHDNTFNGCAKGIPTGGATCYIHDNRFVDVTTPVGSGATYHNNMVNGTFVS